MIAAHLSRRQVLAATLAASAAGALGTKAHALETKARTDAVVLCYSRSGNTLSIASTLADALHCPLMQLQVREPYARAYQDMTYVARDEKRRRARREIADPVPDVTGYTHVFVGSPIWWGGLSVPMWTYLSDHALAGQTIHPFFTSGSSTPDGALAELRALCPKASFGAYFHADSSSLASATQDALEWMQRELF